MNQCQFYFETEVINFFLKKLRIIFCQLHLQLQTIVPIQFERQH